MATKLKSKSALKGLEDELTELANAQFSSEDYQRMLNATFTLAGAQQFFLQHSLFNLNRRDCWGYVQAAAPLPVKKLVWEHESEELGGVAHRGGANHYELAVKQGESLQLAPEDYYKAQPMDATLTCCYAWINLANKSPWLEAFAASAALEYSNSEDIIRGGGVSRRLGEKLRDELGIPMKKQYSNEEHVEADKAHGQMLMQIAEIYCDSDEARAQIVSGCKKSWAIDRVFRGFLGGVMETYAD
ncbi:MAG: iron-containing redox enzyme family protein [Alphaproteobacteria bacterium]